MISVAIINARSVLNKIDDIGAQFRDKGVHVCLCSETWQTDELLTDNLIESLEQTFNVTWHGRGRNGRRGGGVSVITSNNYFKSVTLDIYNQEVETVWVAATPQYDQSLTVIFSAFYSSSSSDFKPAKDALQDHYLDIMEQLNVKFGRVVYAFGWGFK